MRSKAAAVIVPEAAEPDAAPEDEEVAAPKAELLEAALDAIQALHRKVPNQARCQHTPALAS